MAQRVVATTTDKWNGKIGEVLSINDVFLTGMTWVDFGDGVPRFLRSEEYEYV